MASSSKPSPKRTPRKKEVAQPVVETALAELPESAASEAVEWPIAAAEPETIEPIQWAAPIEDPVAAEGDLAAAAPETLTASKAGAAARKGIFVMSDPIETVKSYTEEAKSRIQGAVAEMNEKAKVAMEKSAKAFEEMSELTKGNLEAMVESSKIAAKGLESLGQEAAEFGRKSFEKSSTTVKSFASIKSPTEFFQLQSELMTAAMDSFASEGAKSSEAMLKLANDIAQPISNRVAIVSEKLKALAA